MRRVRSAGLLIAMLASGCGRETMPASHAAPATVTHPTTEAALSQVALSADAVKRLGLETVVVSMGSAAATRSLAGEIIVPPGQTVVITAPVAGALRDLRGLQPGTRVRQGQRLLTIAPLMPVEREQRTDAQRALSTSEAEELAARQRVERLQGLLTDGGASVRSVEEARAQHSISVAAVTAARERLTNAAGASVGARGELVVSAPFDGIVQTLTAAEGQTVPAASALLEVARVGRLWVRVPAFSGDADAIARETTVAVRKLGGSRAVVTGTPVASPLRGNPLAASVDLFYALAGNAGSLRPGERVVVEIPLAHTEAGLTVPVAAVLYDVHGDPWVYEQVRERTYQRRRIEIVRHAGEIAVVGRGLQAGVRVVTAGAAELFGTEFGAGH